ncbi:MAG: FxsA family protein [Marmoricola sp.]
MRRPRPLPLLGAVALALPVLEVLVIIRVGHWLGAAPTFLLLVAGVLLGAWLIRREGERSLRHLADGLRRGSPSTRGLADSAWMVLAGVLFIVPGFITDVVASCLLIPWTRRRLSRRRGVGPRPPRTDGEPTVVRGDVL